jgi:hypothetical protein
MIFPLGEAQPRHNGQPKIGIPLFPCSIARWVLEQGPSLREVADEIFAQQIYTEEL